MKIMKLFLKIKGFPINQAVSELKKIQLYDKKNLEAFNNEIKWKIYHHHYENNPSYNKFIRSRPITCWEDIPLMNKSAIQAPLSDRFSKGYSIKNSHLHNTSGSSGTPFFFAKDKYCHALSWAIIYDRFEWHGIKNGKDLQARFYGIPKGLIGSFKERIKDLISARVRFPIFDLSDKVLDQFFKSFMTRPFVYVNGYTSSLVMMAKYCIEKNITIKSVCPTLKKVFTTSEVCDDLDKKILENGFGVPVINEYGAAELDLIGFEDQNGDWLVNYETLFVEILDDNNLPVNDGQEGKVVVTSLYNKAMPFIRYELGDRAILKKQKKGPYQVLESVKGRINDIAILPSGKKVPGLTFYYISKKLLEEGGFMKEFVIRQKKTNHFHYDYVANRKINAQEIKNVMSAMELYLEKGLEITFKKTDVIKRSASGKLKHFFSENND
jgi:phenylacetate-CoA ligase